MIYLGADKHGFEVIDVVAKWLEAKNIPYKNLGVSSSAEDIPLEELLPILAKSISSDDDQVITSCGTGVGVEVGINKFSGIRACLATDPQIAKWAKVYDKCNVLCLSGWKKDPTLIHHILSEWFAAQYDGSEKRLAMFAAFDAWH